MLARDNDEVDDGWLCDKGRFGFQMIASDGADHRSPRVSGSRAELGAALDAAAERPARSGRAHGRDRRRAAPPTRRATWSSGSSAGRSARPTSTSVDELDAGAARRALSAPELGAAIADLDTPSRSSSSAPTRCTRCRSSTCGSAQGRAPQRQRELVVASERPTALDGGAEETARYAPGGAARLPGRARGRARRRRARGRVRGERRAARRRAAARQDGDRLGRAPRARAGGAAALAGAARAAPTRSSSTAGGRRPDRGPRRRQRPRAARGRLPARRRARASPRRRPAETSSEIKQGLLERRARRGDPRATPTRSATCPTARAGRRRCARRAASIAVSIFDDASTAARRRRPARPRPTPRRRARSPTPTAACSGCGPRVPHPGDVRPIWQALAELSAGLGDETGVDSATEVLAALAAEVPFYAGITHRGDRRPRGAVAGARGRGRCVPGRARSRRRQAARQHRQRPRDPDGPMVGCGSAPTGTSGPTR